MSFTHTATVSRRDAAVAAALSGAVLVILGYASGWGLDLPTALAAEATVVQPKLAPPDAEPDLVPAPPTLVQLPTTAPASVTTLTPVTPASPAPTVPTE